MELTKDIAVLVREHDGLIDRTRALLRSGTIDPNAPDTADIGNHMEHIGRTSMRHYYELMTLHQWFGHFILSQEVIGLREACQHQISLLPAHPAPPCHLHVNGHPATRNP